jgi:hypothetical protein
MRVKLYIEHWYEHVPKVVETNQEGKVTILWNKQMKIDRTIPNNEPDIIMCDSEKGTCMLIDIAISGDRTIIKQEAERILKYKKPYNRNTAHVECKNKCDTSNNRGNWNHFKIIQKIPEQRTGKARNQGTTENSHSGHCTHTHTL